MSRTYSADPGEAVEFLKNGARACEKICSVLRSPTVPATIGELADGLQLISRICGFEPDYPGQSEREYELAICESRCIKASRISLGFRENPVSASVPLTRFENR